MKEVKRRAVGYYIYKKDITKIKEAIKTKSIKTLLENIIMYIESKSNEQGVITIIPNSAHSLRNGVSQTNYISGEFYNVLNRISIKFKLSKSILLEQAILKLSKKKKVEIKASLQDAYSRFFKIQKSYDIQDEKNV